MIYELPTYAEIDGEQFAIRDGGDWRTAIRCIEAFNDTELTLAERWNCAVIIFFHDYDKIANTDEAMRFIDFFINGGFYSDDAKNPDTENDNSFFDTDFPMMVETINLALGKDIRTENVHWWTILGYTRQCEPTGQFATVLTIRGKKKDGQKLDKRERDFERENYNLINPRAQLTDEEKAWLNDW